MPNSNSDNMTLEDKIVQTIKDTHLFALVQDEDAIAKLVHRAITEALFKDRPDQTDGYGRVIRKLESPVIAATREVAQKLVDRITAEILENILNSDEARKSIFKTMISLLPSAINGFIQKNLQDTVQAQTHKINNELLYDLTELENKLIVRNLVPPADPSSKHAHYKSDPNVGY